MYQDLINKCEKVFEKEYLALIDLLNSEKFFSGDFDLEGYETTTDEEMALNIHMDQDANPEKGIYISYPDMYTDVSFDLDIRDIDLLEEDKNTYDIVLEDFFSFRRRLEEHIVDMCKRKDIWFYVDFIATDFINLYDYKAFPKINKGKRESLFLDKQLEVYAHGGFPYCWVGKYPEGKLLVYLPQKK